MNSLWTRRVYVVILWDRNNMKNESENEKSSTMLLFFFCIFAWMRNKTFSKWNKKNQCNQSFETKQTIMLHKTSHDKISQISNHDNNEKWGEEKKKRDMKHHGHFYQ